ncbi:MAG: MASE4 domain-containing protein, partial [Trinickia sp.]
MEATLTRVPTTRGQRSVAAIAAIAVLCAAIAAWPYLTVQGAVVRPFMPIFAATVTLTEGLTAFLLWTQFRATGRLYFAAVASAYAFTSAAAAFHLSVYPGVLSTAPIKPSEHHTTNLIWGFLGGGIAQINILSQA